MVIIKIVLHSFFLFCILDTHILSLLTHCSLSRWEESVDIHVNQYCVQSCSNKGQKSKKENNSFGNFQMAAESLCKLWKKILEFGLCLRTLNCSICSEIMMLDFSMFSSFSGDLCRKSRLKANSVEKILIVIPSNASFSINNQRLAKANYSHYFPGSIIQRMSFEADTRDKQHYICWKQFFFKIQNHYDILFVRKENCCTTWQSIHWGKTSFLLPVTTSY